MFQNRKRIILFTAIFALAFAKVSNCQLPEFYKRLSSGRVVNKDFIETIPFTFIDERICVKAKINNFKKEYNFILCSPLNISGTTLKKV